MRHAMVVLIVAGCGDTPTAHDASIVIDGAPASGACSQAGGYTSHFAVAENPISESGVWAQGGHSTGVDWSDVRTANQLAFGTQTGADGYNDSIALLSGCGAKSDASRACTIDA